MYFKGEGIDAVKVCESGDYVIYHGEKRNIIYRVRYRANQFVWYNSLCTTNNDVGLSDCLSVWNNASPYSRSNDSNSLLHIKDDANKAANCTVISEVKRSECFDVVCETERDIYIQHVQQILDSNNYKLSADTIIQYLPTVLLDDTSDMDILTNTVIEAAKNILQ